jgi:hypothetical protein
MSRAATGSGRGQRATGLGAWLRALAAAGAVAGAGVLAQPVVPVDPALGESVVFVRSYEGRYFLRR